MVSLGEAGWSPIRRREPLTIGVPLPRGAVFNTDTIVLEGPREQRKPVQVRSLDQWPDGSIRWALIDCQIDADRGRCDDLVLRFDDANGRDQAAPRPDGAVLATSSADGVRITAGSATFGFFPRRTFPLSEAIIDGHPVIDPVRSGLQITHSGRVLQCSITSVKIEEAGPLRTSVMVQGAVIANGGAELPLDLFARVEAFAGNATLRMAVTIRNRQRAQHPGGRWTLGDAGSVLIESAVLGWQLGSEVRRVQCAAEWGEALTDAAQPFEIHQESSGGDHWDGPIHRNRDGRVPLRFRGYRRRDGAAERMGQRATPIVVVETQGGAVSVAVPQFWQNFPRSIGVRDGRIEIALFPGQSGDAYELQGGEQKTHVALIAFARDTVSAPPLAWAHDPLLAYPTPKWCCDAGVIPFLEPESSEPVGAHRSLVSAALDSESGFFAKRERSDEFGWRNFGDLPADHESAFQTTSELLVSHYNNQYDAIACFAIHFLRTGDRRWWQLMVDLASHVRDIDLYHTEEDKAAYCGGLFWHTSHYLDAGLSTHRSYPKEGPASGGPSAEHNYNAGLMLHYFLTGDPESRIEAINLGKWVVAMDDGKQTVFRWLASGATGLASSTGSPDYHGPGRGAANSILACLVAHRLSGDASFAAKADELIQRCIRPDDNVEARDLLDVERRWSYTVFLQVLGLYLHDRAERGALDDMYWFARESLLTYARWMAANERPYLDQQEKLEFPNETWPAQDLRKADALGWAALFADPAEAEVFRSRAAFFRDLSFSTLLATPKHRHTRPVVLVLANGFRFCGQMTVLPNVARETPKPLRQWEGVTSFEPQKVRALRRARFAAVGFILAGLALAASLLW